MSGNLFDWSTTASSNDSADGDINWTEGQNAKTVNNSARQMMGRIAEFLEDLCGTQTVAGTANAITVTLDSAFTTLANKRIMALRPASDNTGAVTINVNSIGAKAIRKFDSSGEVALAAGDLQAGGIYLLVYSTAANASAGAWILLNPTPIVYQTQSDLLDDIAALATTDGNFIVMNGTTATVENGATARASMGLGSIATQASSSVSITGGSISGITDLAVADGGTGASTAAGARTALFGVSTTTDNALARYDGTTGALQNSGVTVDDSGNMTVSGSITADGNKVAEFYSGATAGTTSFPIGQHLMISNVAPAPNRMATCTPSLHNTDTTKYVLSGDANAGASLTGTWHSIGYDSGANILFVQRTA